jgi:uncharacterized iron-regulated membrane protein
LAATDLEITTEIGVLRAVSVVIHRWVGLSIAAFIFFSGITGAVISWDHPLDNLLNSHLTQSNTPGNRLSPFELIRQVEERYPLALIRYAVLDPEEGESFVVSVEPRIDPATNKRAVLGFNQVFLDPVSGEERGKREWGAGWPITKETFVSWLYRFHYTLHIPEFWGINTWGQWLFGAVALIWTLDCFVGFYLTLPSRRRASANRPVAVQRQLSRGFWARWSPAWQIKTSRSSYRINFDIHRALGLWTWVLLVMIAFTGCSLNLEREVFTPVLSLFSKVTPSWYTSRTPTPLDVHIEPRFTHQQLYDMAVAEARRQGITAPAASIYYNPQYGIGGVDFFERGDDHGATGIGPASLSFDMLTGQTAGSRIPWKGTTADVFQQLQFPLHSGRILGQPGRILISLMGLISAALSVTGVVIWYRKRRARAAKAKHASQPGAVLLGQPAK